MSENQDLLQLAGRYHQAMPVRIRRYLNRRGIPNNIIDFYVLGWNGRRVTIPIWNRQGEIAFFRLAQDPDDPIPGPKVITTPGAYVELYGWNQLLSKPSEIIICEGEFDRLVLESRRFSAVTSTGGAGVFRAEWAKEFQDIPEVYICFDRDEAGRRGAVRVGQMISHAKLIDLPAEVGEGGDVTDFFVRLGKARKDFRKLMEQAQSAPKALPAPSPRPTSAGASKVPALKERIEGIKKDVSIAKVIGQYVELRPSGKNLAGLCPFHDDRNPSLVVYKATGTFYCYGCFKHGDGIAFLQEIEHLTFGQALQALERFQPDGSQPQDNR